jgi:hypothetical protein
MRRKKTRSKQGTYKWALGSAGRREPILPLRPQISRVAAASTIPVTRVIAQANSRMSFRIIIDCLPAPRRP